MCCDTMQVQLNLWVAGYYADASSSLDSVAKELEAWLVSIRAAARGCIYQQLFWRVAAAQWCRCQRS